MYLAVDAVVDVDVAPGLHPGVGTSRVHTHVRDVSLQLVYTGSQGCVDHLSLFVGALPWKGIGHGQGHCSKRSW